MCIQYSNTLGIHQHSIYDTVTKIKLWTFTDQFPSDLSLYGLSWPTTSEVYEDQKPKPSGEFASEMEKI
jgi:hypothetical protein